MAWIKEFGVSVEIHLLGTFEARQHGQAIELSSRRLRVLLATLALSAGRTVSVDVLAGCLWGEELPARVAGSLSTYVVRLRKIVGQELITTQPNGYRLELDPDHVDVLRLVRLVDSAGGLQDSQEERAVLGEALALWRGEPFVRLGSETLEREHRPQLVERYLTALERRVDLDLAAGQYASLVAELRELTARHPLRESLWVRLIIALRGSGRHAEALDCYETCRKRLAETLGADPGAELQQLHRDMLTADPNTATTPATPTRPGAEISVVPRQLPAALGPLIGRTPELAQLSDLVGATTEQNTVVAVTAIGGVGGIGKTALALHWAHHNTDQFPDGQLFVNLRGFDPSGEPLTPTLAVRGFLVALGVESAAIPTGLDEQVGLYRSLVAGKRMLVVLDNARDSAQVMPLLPGSPTCTVLVTSRDRLTGLVTTHGAQPLALDFLEEHQARDVLAQRLGRRRLEAEPEAVTELLTYCAGLPLALSILAGRAHTHPKLPLATLADELHDTRTRLDALNTGDAHTNLDTVLSWSYAALTSQQAAVFGLLGIAAGPDISVHAVANLANLPMPQARTVLRELTRVSLVDEHAPGRYRMHDLTRLSATNHAQHNQPSQDRETALRRLTDFYLHTAFSGMQLLNPAHERVKLDEPAVGCHPYPLADHAEALTWFDAEHPNLLAIQQLAIERDWHHPVWQLAWTTSIYHYRRGHFHDQLTALRAGLAAADHLQDPIIQSRVHRYLGEARVRAGHHAEAIDHLQRALTLAEHVNDRHGQAHTHHYFASVWEDLGNDQRALEHAHRCLSLYQALQEPTGEADAHILVGWHSARLGYQNQARPHLETALDLHRRHRDLDGEAATLYCLGYLDHCTGHYTQALEHYQSALYLRRAAGNTTQEADSWERLGDVHTAVCQHNQARHAWQQALHLYQTHHRTTDADRVQQQLNTLGHPGASGTG